jgi:hypothetical protein
MYSREKAEFVLHQFKSKRLLETIGKKSGQGASVQNNHLRISKSQPQLSSQL